MARVWLSEENEGRIILEKYFTAPGFYRLSRLGEKRGDDFIPPFFFRLEVDAKREPELSPQIEIINQAKV